MGGTKIEYVSDSWNPVVGCNPISRGCENCWAARMASTRLKGMYGDMLTKRGRWNGTVRCFEDRLRQPLHWRKPRRVAVSLMGDLFHPNADASFVTDVFDVMQEAKQHTFLVLTKRPKEMAAVLYGERGNWYLGGGDYLANVWLGVSVEDKNSLHRVDELLALDWPGVTWVSLEPLLGPVQIREYLCNYAEGRATTESPFRIRKGISWVVAGGESGPNARPMDPDWARHIRSDCAEAGVPFFFKQWGEWCPTEDLTPEGSALLDLREGDIPVEETGRTALWRVGKKTAGALLDGREHKEFPLNGQETQDTTKS